MSKIRALVVEDSQTVRRHLVALLQEDPDLDVIGEAADGRQAIDLCKTLRPDVIALDLVLPGIDGVAVTEHIMAYCPTPILIVSAANSRQGRVHTRDALSAGAVDVLDKPDPGSPDSGWGRRFVATMKLVSRIRVITHPRVRLGRLGYRPVPGGPVPAQGCQVIALGASTGGPGALVTILRAMPAPFPLPILVVTHMGSDFGDAFSAWLDGQTPHHVALAQGGESVAGLAERVVLAPPGRHLVVRRGHLQLTDEAEVHSCRPSVDVLFTSLAEEYGQACSACLLTGMGRDGAAGLLAIRRAGGGTVAQDETTSIVYGMPREAMLIGAATQVLPLEAIGPALARLAAPRRPEAD